MTISEPFQAQQLNLLLPDFPVKTSHLQTHLARDWRVRDRDCSLRLCDSFAQFDPVTCSWKTSQLSFPLIKGETLASYSGSWPRSGMMRSGTVYLRPSVVPTTYDPGYGLLPTPTATDMRDPLMHPDLTRELEESGIDPEIGRRNFRWANGEAEIKGFLRWPNADFPDLGWICRGLDPHDLSQRMGLRRGRLIGKPLSPCAIALCQSLMHSGYVIEVVTYALG